MLVPGAAAQEKAGFAVLGQKTVALADTAPEEAWYVIHEVAHQWFGRALGPRDWSENWLNEGFAVLATALFSGAHFGAERASTELTRARTRSARGIERGRDRPLSVPDWTSPGDSGGPIPYTKGLLVLDLLRARVGADAFDRGIRQLFAAPAAFTSEALLTAIAPSEPIGLADVPWIDSVGDPALLLAPAGPLDSAP